MNALKILEIGCVPEAFWFSRLAASVCGLAKHGIAWHSDNCKATSWYPAVVQAGNSFVESNSADLSMGTWGCSIKNWLAYLQPVLDHQFWKDNTYTLPVMSRKIEPDNLPNQGLPKYSPAQQWPPPAQALRRQRYATVAFKRVDQLTMIVYAWQVCECTVYCHNTKNSISKLIINDVEVHDGDSKIRLASRS